MNVGPVVDRYLEARDAQDHDPNTLIGVCAQAAEAGELTDLESFAILFLLVSAGGESTTSLTGTGGRILAQRPELQGRLRREPELVPEFVEEACRIDPPFRMHHRAVVADTELGGVRIPGGSSLLLAWPAANHDRNFFPNPDEIASTVRIRASTSASDGASTSASARPSHGSKRRSHSSNCSPAPSPSRSNRRAHRCVTI
jgi:cytochrome P450